MTDIEAKARAEIARILGNDPIAVGRFTQATEDALVALVTAARAEAVSPRLDEDGYLWKWVERGLFDPHVTPKEALSVIAHYPAAPWNNGRWDVDHKPYAKAFYEKFPKALAQGTPEQDGGGGS